MTAFDRVRTLCAAITFAIAGSVISSAADDLAECNSDRNSSEIRIAACSRVIQAGSAKESDLRLALAHRADAYRRLGEYERALAEYSELQRRTGGDGISAYIGSALVYIEIGQRDRAVAALNEAIQFYSEAIKREPNGKWHFGWRAFAYRYTGAFDLAIADYDAAIALEPSFSFWRTNRAEVQFYKGDLTKAHADFTEVIERSPDDAWTRTMRGRVYEQGWAIRSRHLRSRRRHWNQREARTSLHQPRSCPRRSGRS